MEARPQWDIDFFKSTVTDEGGSLIKSRKGLPVGTIRDWQGKKYIKTGKGWKPYTKGEGKKEEKKKGSRQGYINEKPSEIKNVGEDVYGAKRHNYNTYSLEQLEKKGMAQKVINKKFLLGDFDLDLEKRKKRGESEGKILSVYAVKKLLPSNPPDNVYSRFLYDEFIKMIERTDTNSSTSSDFLNTLSDWLNMDYAEKEKDKHKDLFGKKTGRTINQLSVYQMRWEKNDVIGPKLQSLFGNKRGSFLSVGNKIRMLDREEDKKEIKKQSSYLLGLLGYKGEGASTLPKKNDQVVLDGDSWIGKAVGRRGYPLKGKVVGKTGSRWKVEFSKPDGSRMTGDVSYWEISEIKKDSGAGRKHKKTAPTLFQQTEFVRQAGSSNKGSVKTVQNKLKKDMNFRAIQYGNSVSDDERDFHTRRTFEAFEDLSKILGIPENKITLNGRLAIAFGARGKAGALAHYEPYAKTINLTRAKGMGSLAHEWGHFFDNVVSNQIQGGSGAGYISMGDKKKSVVSVPISDLKEGDIISTGGKRYYYRAGEEYPLVRLKSGTDYPSESSSRYKTRFGATSISVERDGGGRVSELISRISNTAFSRMKDHLNKYPPYWSKKNELFARSFEAYISDRAKTKKRVNSYLQSENKTKHKDAKDVYPQGPLRTELNKLFDELWKEVRKSDVLQKAMDTFSA